MPGEPAADINKLPKRRCHRKRIEGVNIPDLGKLYQPDVFLPRGVHFPFPLRGLNEREVAEGAIGFYLGLNTVTPVVDR